VAAYEVAILSLSLSVRENEFAQRLSRDISVDEIHILHAELHAQLPRQQSITAI
jgi:hypothetical protein